MVQQSRSIHHTVSLRVNGVYLVQSACRFHIKQAMDSPALKVHILTFSRKLIDGKCKRLISSDKLVNLFSRLCDAPGVNVSSEIPWNQGGDTTSSALSISIWEVRLSAALLSELLGPLAADEDPSSFSGLDLGDASASLSLNRFATLNTET